MNVDFSLHPGIESTTRPVCRLRLSAVRIMDDRRFPWLILVPERAGLREIYELPAELRAQLMDEIAGVSAALQHAVKAPKINIGALGNIVPQLHVHVVARDPKDAAWPGPVWGHAVAVPYEKSELHHIKSEFLQSLKTLEIAAKPT